MPFSQGIILIRHHPSQRARLREMAGQLKRAKISADMHGKPLIAFVISPEDRELLTDALYTIAEAVVDE